MHFKRFGLMVGMALLCSPLWALTSSQAHDIAVGETDARIAALNAALNEPSDRLLTYLNALSNDAVKVKDDQVYVMQGAQAVDAVQGTPLEVPADAEDAMLNNRLRGEVDAAMAALKLFSNEVSLRRLAIQALIKEPEASKRTLIEQIGRAHV